MIIFVSKHKRKDMAKIKGTGVKQNVRKKRSPVKVAKVIEPITTTQISGIVENEPITPVYQEPELAAVVSSPEPEIIKVVNRNEPAKKSNKGSAFMVGLAGGSAVGYMSFSGLKSTLLDKGYNQDDANQYALITGCISGLITFAILYNLIKTKS